ncbi:hypothetical protein [Salinibacter sp.]|uniref:hypothetical protein n=1 Tax=Salinibacter sp. TaxID=2065818 RepID=UPI0021E7830B|nr:hypothetical protein [Salinibacter sp.]
METVVGILGLALLFWFVYALFKLEEAVYWHENPSRTKAFGYFLLGMFVVGSMSPDASETGDSTSADAQTESTVDKQSNTSSETESTGDEETSSCKRKAGVYAGDYTARMPSGTEEGDSGFVLGPDCEYVFSMDGTKTGEGQASPTSEGSFEMENGQVVRINDGIARMTGEGSNYQAVYKMPKVAE